MCGIFGVVSTQKDLDINLFEKSLKFLAHRGPDFVMSKKVDNTVVLGHTRLSIIDLASTSNQPFSIDERYTLTYNGEIYNYVEIRQELMELGLSFATSGDTEVVLQAYRAWGEDCVNRFNGMWAFAIYDKELKKLFCSRDRFGVKPFSYHLSQGELIFSSEIKPILCYKPGLREPNYNVIANYCYKSLGAQTKETWFKDIYRLYPAHNLIYENGEMRIYRYWDYPRRVDKGIGFEEAVKTFQKIFVDSIRIRMRSDVPVGSTLSSGLDSTSIVGVLAKQFPQEIETFTAFNASKAYSNRDKEVFTDDVELNESITVNELVKEFKVSSNQIELNFNDYLDRLTEAIYFLESGHSAPPIISIHQVYKKAKEKVKVLLEGQGADELLGGYIVDVFPVYLKQLIREGKFKKAYSDFSTFRTNYSLSYLLKVILRSFDNSTLNFFKNKIQGLNIFKSSSFTYKYLKDAPLKSKGFDQNLNSFLHRQHTSGLVNLLHYGDALSMAESIECRLPFMDYRLVEFAFKLPYQFKVNQTLGKYIQRMAMEDYVPRYVLESPIKIGFVSPLDKLFNDSKEVEKVLLNQKCGDLFNDHGVAKLLNEHRKGKANHSTILFRILSSKIWYRIFFESTHEPVASKSASSKTLA